MAICAADFEFVCELVFNRTAIVLGKGKEYLVESRLSSVIQKEGMPSVGHLIDIVRKNVRHPYSQVIVEAMTTNETLFFRDTYPFEALRTKIIPELLENKNTTRTLNIWSAASSTGQEAYSVAMMLRENFPQLFSSWIVKIIGTDINRQVIEKAQRGVYSQLEINRGLPATLLIKYFSKVGATDWQISEEVRSITQFIEMNLTTAWPTLPQFDIVMLRNVLIYFDTSVRQQIISRLRKICAPNALILLGAAETMMDIKEQIIAVDIGKCRCYKFA